ncbi:hypothetical protein Hdeb2414_s0023g00638021 [Helianthus debilis subsp. tardiflorus]
MQIYTYNILREGRNQYLPNTPRQIGFRGEKQPFLYNPRKTNNSRFQTRTTTTHPPPVTTTHHHPFVCERESVCGYPFSLYIFVPTYM